jgi:hypothetical protein
MGNNMTKFRRKEFLETIEEAAGLDHDCALAEILVAPPTAPETGLQAFKQIIRLRSPSKGVAYHTHGVADGHLTFALYHDGDVEPLWIVGNKRFGQLIEPETQFKHNQPLGMVANTIAEENSVRFDEAEYTGGYHFHSRFVGECPTSPKEFSVFGLATSIYCVTVLEDRDHLKHIIEGVTSAQKQLTKIIEAEHERLYRIGAR